MSQKYRQPGYRDSDRDNESQQPRKSKTSREGPRSPRMAGFHEVVRCAMCGATLSLSMEEITFRSNCPKCKAALHTCKNCTFFDPGSRFECTQPIPERISPKDKRNSCQFFEVRTTVEKQTSSATSSTSGKVDPRQAFEDLFKK